MTSSDGWAGCSGRDIALGSSSSGTRSAWAWFGRATGAPPWPVDVMCSFWTATARWTRAGWSHCWNGLHSIPIWQLVHYLIPLTRPPWATGRATSCWRADLTGPYTFTGWNDSWPTRRAWRCPTRVLPSLAAYWWCHANGSLSWAASTRIWRWENPISRCQEL